MKSVVQNSKLSLLPTGFHKSDPSQKMFLSCYIKKNQLVVPKSKEKLSSGGVNVTMETREEAPHSPSTKIRAVQQYSACYKSSGTRVMHPGAGKKNRSRLNTVTHHMDALLTKAPRLFCVLCCFRSLSHVCQKEIKQADLIESNPGAIAHVSNRWARWDRVRFGDALVMD